MSIRSAMEADWINQWVILSPGCLGALGGCIHAILIPTLSHSYTAFLPQTIPPWSSNFPSSRPRPVDQPFVTALDSMHILTSSLLLFPHEWMTSTMIWVFIKALRPWFSMSRLYTPGQLHKNLWEWDPDSSIYLKFSRLFHCSFKIKNHCSGVQLSTKLERQWFSNFVVH